MKIKLMLLCMVVCGWAAGANAQHLIISKANVIDGRTGAVSRAVDIVVEDGVIASVEPTTEDYPEDADKFGDDCDNNWRSPLVQREAAQALKETDLVPSEPVTVVLSENGWVRPRATRLILLS